MRREFHFNPSVWVEFGVEWPPSLIFFLTTSQFSLSLGPLFFNMEW